MGLSKTSPPRGKGVTEVGLFRPLGAVGCGGGADTLTRRVSLSHSASGNANLAQLGRGHGIVVEDSVLVNGVHCVDYSRDAMSCCMIESCWSTPRSFNESHHGSWTTVQFVSSFF